MASATRPGGERRARLLAGEVSTMADYVVPRGGAYLFTPSLSAVRALAAPDDALADEDQPPARKT